MAFRQFQFKSSYLVRRDKKYVVKPIKVDVNGNFKCGAYTKTTKMELGRQLKKSEQARRQGITGKCRGTHGCPGICS